MMSSGVNRVVDRVLAVQLRESETDGLLGVALLVPSERYASTTYDGADDRLSQNATGEGEKGRQEIPFCTCGPPD
jgi:hypothetical protein